MIKATAKRSLGFKSGTISHTIHPNRPPQEVPDEIAQSENFKMLVYSKDIVLHETRGGAAVMPADSVEKVPVFQDKGMAVDKDTSADKNKAKK